MLNYRIPIILNVYKKPDLFKSQMECLSQQSCANVIDLHIISNNPNIDFMSMATPFMDKLKIHFVQKNNDYGCFERHLYAREQQFEYCIFLDDDIVIQNVIDVQKVFDSKEPHTIKSGWMRLWGKLGSPQSYNVNEMEFPGIPGKEYNYYGTALSVFDCKIYDSVMKWFPIIHDKLVQQHQLKIQDFDDIFISWVCAVANFKVTSHGIKYISLEHEEALWKKIITKKNLIVNFLHNIHPWKVLSGVQYRKEQVQQLYRDILKRKVDDKGLNHFVNSNLSIDEIKCIFLNSEKYKKFKITKQPKTFVIALKDHTISLSQLNDCLLSAKAHNWEVETFWGTNGKTLSLDSWKQIGVTPLLHKEAMNKVGTWGCFFSHFSLWNKCVELNEPIVILEHDAIIKSKWVSIDVSKALVKLHENYSFKKDSNGWMDPGGFIDSDSGQASSSTHAYCITPEHANKLIHFAKTVGGYASDRMLGNKVLPVIHMGDPTIVARQNTYSTTENL